MHELKFVIRYDVGIDMFPDKPEIIPKGTKGIAKAFKDTVFFGEPVVFAELPEHEKDVLFVLPKSCIEYSEWQ
jgi:hypothetical protein